MPKIPEVTAVDKHIFYPSDALTFGKYKGRLLREVIKRDPTYVEWCLRTIAWFDINEKAYTLLRKHQSDIRPQHVCAYCGDDLHEEISNEQDSSVEPPSVMQDDNLWK